jgi:hypothetical protein
MTPKEGNTSLKCFIRNLIDFFFLATSSKRISSTDAIAADNMTLYLRGPSPQISGVGYLQFYFFF